MKKGILILTVVLILLIIYGVFFSLGYKIEIVKEEQEDPANKTAELDANFTNQTSTTTTLANATTNATDKGTGSAVKELSEHEKCLEKYSLKESDVIFRYATWTSLSTDWDPVALEVKDKGYNVVKARVGDEGKGTYTENEAYITGCFKEVYKERSLPQFICAGTRDQFIGINPSVNTLRDFAKICNDEAKK